MKQHWPLFTPVLLALVEDEDTVIRERGLHIAGKFLETCPGYILRTTGIGVVFREAIFPTLFILPSLTPEEESVRLLRPAYRALLLLAQSNTDLSDPDRRGQLNKLLQEGVFAGCHHASEHASVVELLMINAEAIVNALGLYATKHLQVKCLPEACDERHC